MCDIIDIVEILTLDQEELIKIIKPNISPFLKKEIYFKIPILRFRYENLLKEQIKRELMFTLINLTNCDISAILEFIEMPEVVTILENFYYDKEKYRR